MVWGSGAVLSVAIATQSVAVTSFVNPEASPDPQLLRSAQSEHFSVAELISLKHHAQAITVKVMAGDNWGSGILVSRKGQDYAVLTNQHVLWIGESYTVQTLDGKRYGARKNTAASFGNDDLGLIHFQSSTAVYPTAKLGCSLSLSKGTPVFAAGFPLPLNEYSTKGFKFTSGAISLIMPKAFEGGYQVGYSNEIEKGMSGGPVLNRWGEVIAVNGMHQEPLWGNPYVYKDGSEPNSGLKDVLFHSSWAIPIETVLEHAGLTALRNQHCIARHLPAVEPAADSIGGDRSPQ